MQALIMVEKIRQKKEALKRTASKRLQNDYTKSIKSDFRELKEYCGYKGLNFERFEEFIKE